MNNKKNFHWELSSAVTVFLVFYDIVAVCAAYFLALWIRFDCKYSMIPTEYLNTYLTFIPFYAMICVFIFWILRLYKSIWKFASNTELIRTLAASAITVFIHIIGITLFLRRMPISYHLFGAMFQLFFVLGVRFSYRFIILEYNLLKKYRGEERLQNVMLIGAGAAGQMILRDLERAKENENVKVRCIIDDDPNKKGRFIDGIPIVGNRDEILSAVQKYKIDKIFLAIPSANAETKRDLLSICNETNCELKILPGIYQLVNGEVSINEMKDVAVEDLLGRDTITVNMDEIFCYLTDKTILITGGGGSIGSELCRQIAEHHPKQLIIFDVYENNAYEIEQELKSNHPELNLVVLIGSVRDSRRINQVFKKYQPNIVYHAAAHKHVPLMETSPCEAIKNNAIGTYKTAWAAIQNGCERFVLISTDKAVNPTNVMGASKRLCEMIIQTFDKMIKEHRANELPALFAHEEYATSKVQPVIPIAKTEFVAVRFGNVLGSNGSVIPLFKKQIQKGGPVTVTHPDIIRYFMTIPEAVSLVLQAGTYAHGGEIFVLDMGAPVKIDTLARNLIRLSGYKPDIDIPIHYTGLRPGEKLYEEKLMTEEGMRKTPNELIYIGNAIAFDTDTFLQQFQHLMDACYNNQENIKDLIAKIVTTYRPTGEHGSEQKGLAYQEQIQLMKQVAITKDR